MPKRFIKKYLPDANTLKKHKYLNVFGTLLHDQNLWHLNRHSFSGAVAIGLFVAFIPLPAQMVIAAAAAIVIRVNLPVSVAIVWLTNPITMPPLFYAAYWVGTLLMDIPPDTHAFKFSIDTLLSGLQHTWKPFLLGCFVLGSTASALGYGLARILWRWVIIKKWSLRKRKK